MWAYVEGQPLVGGYATLADVPTQSPLSLQISKDLKAAGFKFCGPTIIYAWMEACGLFNNHALGCQRHHEVQSMAR
jgi:DNA-3-methyladenine glycosylase I